MSKKTYAVIGMGKFGKAVTLALAEEGADVIAVDNHMEKVQDVADVVSYALEADVTDPAVLNKIGIGNVDVVIVGIADNMEASIIATIYAKEQGVPYVMAKAMSKLHGEILQKVGADQVIYPEVETGKRVAKNLLFGGFRDFYKLTEEYSMAEMAVPVQWHGKNLIELNLREAYGINIVGIKDGDKVTINPDPQVKLVETMEIIIVGENEKLRQLKSKG